MDALSKRFEPLHPLFQPVVHVPKKKEKDLDLLTYLVPIPLLYNHGNAPSPTLKLEFHFDAKLPPDEEILGSLGGVEPQFHARVPRLPYQVALKLLTLPRPPVGVPATRDEDAIPRQLYDLDHLSASLSEDDWTLLVEYFAERYIDEAKGEADAQKVNRGRAWRSAWRSGPTASIRRRAHGGRSARCRPHRSRRPLGSTDGAGARGRVGCLC